MQQLSADALNAPHPIQTHDSALKAALVLSHVHDCILQKITTCYLHTLSLQELVVTVMTAVSFQVCDAVFSEPQANLHPAGLLMSKSKKVYAIGKVTVLEAP